MSLQGRVHVTAEKHPIYMASKVGEIRGVEGHPEKLPEEELP